MHLHDPVGIGIVERPQQHRVDDAEDGAVGADAQRQRQQGGRGEPTGAEQPADPVARILKEHLDRWQPALFAIALLHLGDSSESSKCGSTRVGGRQAAPHVLLRQHLDMKLDFVVEVHVERPTSKQSGDADEKRTHVSPAEAPLSDPP